MCAALGCHVPGDVPLLLSRSGLAKLGVVLNVAENRADFAALGLKDARLITTDTGHPALPVRPVCNVRASADKVRRGHDEIIVFPRGEQYTVFMAGGGTGGSGGTREQPPVLFYPKKIPLEVKNILLGESFSCTPVLDGGITPASAMTSGLRESTRYSEFMLFPGGSSSGPSSGPPRILSTRETSLELLVRSVYGIV